MLVKEGDRGVSYVLTSPLLLCFNRIFQFRPFRELLFFFPLGSLPGILSRSSLFTKGITYDSHILICSFASGEKIYLAVTTCHRIPERLILFWRSACQARRLEFHPVSRSCGLCLFPRETYKTIVIFFLFFLRFQSVRIGYIVYAFAKVLTSIHWKV